jgi:hypothetical protein
MIRADRTRLDGLTPFLRSDPMDQISNASRRRTAPRDKLFRSHLEPANQP